MGIDFTGQNFEKSSAQFARFQMDKDELIIMVGAESIRLNASQAGNDLLDWLYQHRDALWGAEPNPSFAEVLAMPEEPEEPAMTRCPYCRQYHAVGTVEQCPLNPKRTRPYDFLDNDDGPIII